MTLVQDLRSEQAYGHALCGEAADRIEQLEAALREIDAVAVSHVKGGIGKAQVIARAALAGEKPID